MNIFSGNAFFMDAIPAIGMMVPAPHPSLRGDQMSAQARHVRIRGLARSS
jgi:hypothetical protein